MIVVIADDLTGAAELGGIGLNYQLNVEINTQIDLHSKADLVVIATDTRSMTKAEAMLETARVTTALAVLEPELIFKKVDSVLRGHIAEELQIMMQNLGYNSVLLVAANPKMGRTITNGRYLLYNTPLHLSSFASDPEFPARTSNVVELLGNKGIEVHSQKHDEAIETAGLIIGDAGHPEDLELWASIANIGMLLAGASGFFTALLDKRPTQNAIIASAKPRSFKNPMLIVSGTSFAKSREAIKKLKESGTAVSYMPAVVINKPSPDEADYELWRDEIIAFIKRSGKAIVAVNEDIVDPVQADAKDLRYKTAIVIKMVFDRITINELLIEGGSTASAILKLLCLYKLFPVEELATGVIRMQTENKPELYVTLKPGSYNWPQVVQPYSLY
jgi:uncharacterized protein YgbK (DUF1537 family)